MRNLCKFSKMSNKKFFTVMQVVTTLKKLKSLIFNAKRPKIKKLKACSHNLNFMLKPSR